MIIKLSNKTINWLIIFLYAVYFYIIWNDLINDSIGVIVLLLSITIVTIIYASLRLFRGKSNMEIFILFVLLSFNILINSCGIGAILCIIELYMLLRIAPYVNFSNKDLKLFYYLGCIAVVAYGYKIMRDPTVLIAALGGNTNGNMVGIIMYNLSCILLLTFPSSSLKNIILLLISLSITAAVTFLSGCRSALFSYIALILVYVGCLLFGRHINFRLIRRLFPFLVVALYGGLIFVIYSTNINSNGIEDEVGHFSDLLRSDKGSTLSLREEIWKEALEAFVHTPIIGTGSKLRIQCANNPDALALHSSTMNLLIVYGIFVYFIITRRYCKLFKRICYSIADKRKMLLSITAFAGVLFISYFESNLLDYFMYFSIFPLFYVFSIINNNRVERCK